MNEDDKQAFTAKLVMVANYYNVELTSDVIEMNWALVNKWNIQDVLKSFDLHMSHSKHGRWMPKAADLILYLESVAPEGMEWNATRGAWKRIEHNGSALVSKT